MVFWMRCVKGWLLLFVVSMTGDFFGIRKKSREVLLVIFYFFYSFSYGKISWLWVWWHLVFIIC